MNICSPAFQCIHVLSSHHLTCPQLQILLFTNFLVLVPLGWQVFFYGTGSCGPFQDYQYMFCIISDTTSKAPSGLSDLLYFIASVLSQPIKSENLASLSLSLTSLMPTLLILIMHILQVGFVIPLLFLMVLTVFVLRCVLLLCCLSITFSRLSDSFRAVARQRVIAQLTEWLMFEKMDTRFLLRKRKLQLL